eukprot:6483599-Amphidinium_carterae.1
MQLMSQSSSKISLGKGMKEVNHKGISRRNEKLKLVMHVNKPLLVYLILIVLCQIVAMAMFAGESLAFLR